MKKRKIHVFNKDMYLLGINQEGKKVWLEEPSWDCDWYWGFGYLEILSLESAPEKSKDIISHTHWDSSVRNSGKNAYDWFKEYFKDTPLKEKEIWVLCELMATFYCLREYSDFCHRGGMHYTENPIKNKLQDDTYYKHINNELMPEVFEKIKTILIEGYEKWGDMNG